jgi:hypothetical protein
MASVKPDYIIQLQGRSYPTYPGVLDLAHEIGLQEIRTELVQTPGPDNDHVAIARAEVTMKDGRIFTGIGDAGPKNLKPNMVPASIRMAETRAKGRALRDAVNVGEALLEEMPDGEPDTTPAARPAAARPAAPAPPAAARPDPPAAPAPTTPAAPATGSYICTEAGCERALTQGQQAASMREFGQGLCPACQKKRREASTPAAAGAAA